MSRNYREDDYRRGDSREMVRYRSVDDLFRSIDSIQNSEKSIKYESFMTDVFRSLITTSISDTHRFDKNIYIRMGYESRDDRLCIVICIEINEKLGTIKHSIIKEEEVIRMGVDFIELDDQFDDVPMTSASKTRNKLNASIDEYMFELNMLTNEIADLIDELLYTENDNIDIVNDILSRNVFQFGGIVVKPLIINNSVEYQYSFNRFMCQNLKGDAMFATARRNE